METKNNKLGFETYRAEINESTINDEERSFDVVFATENPVLLQGYKYADRFETFTEILKCDKMFVRTKRMDSGLPIFSDHWDRTIHGQLGITTRCNFEVGKITGTIKLGARADEALWSDIKNGITKTVSVGCNIYKVERFEDGDKNITYTATDWEPKHIAFAPEPADIDATIRSENTVIISKNDGIIVEDKQESILNSIFNL